MPMDTKVVVGLLGATLLVAAVALVGSAGYIDQDVELAQMVAADHTSMLKTRHYTPPNPFEDPELRDPYKFDKSKELATSKKVYTKAKDEIVKAQKIMTAVVKKLKAQDTKRDALMDEALAIAGRIKSVRHLLIMVKSEVGHIRTTEDGNWIFKNPFGRSHDPPAQILGPFKDMTKKLNGKTEKIEKDLKALIKKTRKRRMKAILLNADLYDEVKKAKGIAKEAKWGVHVHLDRVEMLNRRDFDEVHRVETKLNDKFRIERHRLRGLYNEAKDMSARQPNEVSEITHMCTVMLINNAETEERISRMEKLIASVEYQRKFYKSNKSGK